MMASSSHGEEDTSTTPSRSSSGGASEVVALKKGPWTAAEDAILMDYVSKNGEGNWNAVQRNSGLQRCGKSCRLRWANHLRPNLKKCAFTPDEERLILQLHAKFGNKWARMAAQMPGRTDNEIKNYWNTRMKRHQRAGLAIYPTDIQSGQSQHRHQRHRKQHHQHHALRSASTTSHSQMLDFQNQRAINFNPTPQPQPFLFTTHEAPIPSHHHQQFNFFTEQSNANNAPQSYQTSLFSGAASHSLFVANPLHQPLELTNCHQEPNSSAGNICSSDFGFVHLLSSHMSSMQSVGCDDHRLTEGNGSNGMLDDVLNNNAKDNHESSNHQLLQPALSKKMKEDQVYKLGAVTWKDCGVTTPENSSSGLTSIGVRVEEPVVEINPLDDDELTSLLESFPSASPTPQWYRRGTHTNDSSSDAHGGVVLDLIHPMALADQLLPSDPASAEAAANNNGDTDQVLSLGGSSSSASISWHNLPTIY